MKTPKSFLKYAGGALIIGACALPVVARSGGAAPLRLAQAAAEEGTLTVVAENGVKSETPGMGRLEVGAVDTVTTPKVEHDFILRNDTKKPIAIGRLQPTCGCTSVLLGENGETTKTLAPGEQTKIRVSVDVTRFRGTISKSVRAYSADNALLATMEVIAIVQEPVAFSTNSLNFGRVNFGARRTAPFTMTLSPRLLEKKNLPKLVSSSPYLLVEPATDKTSAPNANERHYVITISPKAPIGYLTGTVGFAVPAANNATAPATASATAEADPEKRLQAALQGAAVPFMFEVVGKISATPQMVVLADKTSKQRITIASTEPALLKKLKVASSNPMLQTRLVEPDAKAKAEKPSAILELSLSPRTPAGALEAQVTITATDGERLTVPVIAEVAK